MKKYTKLYAIIPFLGTFLILTILFHDLFLNINNFLYDNGGDSLKNYFHFALYTKYGSYLHLNEVNYPFAEHIIFLDSQPVLAFIANKLSLSRQAVALVNLMPFISLIITAPTIFLIQRFLGLPVIFNIFSSIIITLLSPQILRFEAHHSLAYTFIIPLVILLLLYAHRSKSYFVVISVVSLFASFIHIYFLLIILFLVFTYSFLVLLKRKKIVYFTYAITSILIPFIIFKGVLYFSDKIKDRPEIPSGGARYRSTFEGVFLPHNGQYFNFLSNTFNLKPKNVEKLSYVGKLGLPVLAFMLISLGFRFIKGRNTTSLYHNLYLFELCWVACFIWVFAMYYPFKELIDFVSEYIPAIKQFRSLGRLAWIFFYIFSILISFKIYHLYLFARQKINIKFAAISLVLLYSIWSSDISNNFKNLIDSYTHKSQNIFNVTKKDLDLEKNIDFSKYQASVALPIFHVGSEIRNYEGSKWSIQKVFTLAYFYQLPFISTYSSRVSENQFDQIENLIYAGKIESFARNDKPFLIVADMSALSENDSLVIKKSIFLYEKDNISYFEYANF